MGFIFLSFLFFIVSVCVFRAICLALVGALLYYYWRGHSEKEKVIVFYKNAPAFSLGQMRWSRSQVFMCREKENQFNKVNSHCWKCIMGLTTVFSGSQQLFDVFHSFVLDVLVLKLWKRNGATFFGNANANSLSVIAVQFISGPKCRHTRRQWQNVN